MLTQFLLEAGKEKPFPDPTKNMLKKGHLLWGITFLNNQETSVQGRY